MLKQQIHSDVTGALKSGNHDIAGVLRMALASITSKEKARRYEISKKNPELKEEDLLKESELNDQEVINVVFSEIKKRNDAILLYEKGNRQELADKEKKEIEILKKYLPEQLSKEELTKLVEESVNKIGATSIKDMGKVMADLMPKIKGKADNSEVSKIIKELLNS